MITRCLLERLASQPRTFNRESNIRPPLPSPPPPYPLDGVIIERTLMQLHGCNYRVASRHFSRNTIRGRRKAAANAVTENRRKVQIESIYRQHIHRYPLCLANTFTVSIDKLMSHSPSPWPIVSVNFPRLFRYDRSCNITRISGSLFYVH